jgi:hypothetical protein
MAPENAQTLILFPDGHLIVAGTGSSPCQGQQNPSFGKVSADAGTLNEGLGGGGEGRPERPICDWSTSFDAIHPQAVILNKANTLTDLVV